METEVKDQCYSGGSVIDCENHRWVEYDARGIPLARVCHSCVRKKLSTFRPEVLTDAQYASIEDIEPEPEVGGPY
jgi:hypothetical protein